MLRMRRNILVWAGRRRQFLRTCLATMKYRMELLVWTTQMALRWFRQQLRELFNLDSIDAQRHLLREKVEIEKELAELPTKAWTRLQDKSLPIELEHAKQLFESAYDRRARVLERSSAVLSAASLLLAAAALFYQVPMPPVVTFENENLNSWAWWPMRIYYVCLSLSGFFLIQAVLRCLDQLKPSRVYVPESRLPNSTDTQRTIMTRRGVEYTVLTRGNNNDGLMRTNSLGVAIRKCRHSSQLLAMAAICQVVARIYGEAVQMLTAYIFRIELSGWGRSFVLGCLLVLTIFVACAFKVWRKVYLPPSE